MASEAYDDLGDGDFEDLEHDDGAELDLSGGELELELEEEPVSDEDRARAMGWKPRNEYRGPAGKWTDAAAFIARGEEEMPILRDQNKRMSERLARTETEIADLKQAAQDAIKMARTADDRGYQRALKELKDQQREAVSSGDTEAYDAVAAEIEELEASRTTTAEPLPPAAPATTLDPAIGVFVGSNASWFNDPQRPELRSTMIGLHGAVIQEGRIRDVASQLAEAKSRLAKVFPQHSDLTGEPMAPPTRRDPPLRRGVAPVATPRNGAPGGGPRRPTSSPFEQIPVAERAEAKAAFTRMQRADPELTANEYVAMYIDPHADVLALRRAHRSK